MRKQPLNARHYLAALVLAALTLPGCMEWEEFVCQVRRDWQLEPLQPISPHEPISRFRLAFSTTWQGESCHDRGRTVYTLDTSDMRLRIQTFDEVDRTILDQQRPLMVFRREGSDVVYAFTDEVNNPGFNPARDALRFRPCDGGEAQLISSQGMWYLNLRRI